MKSPTMSDVRKLAAAEPGLTISISFPTHVGFDESGQDAIRLKNAITEAEALLIARGLRAAEARDLLAPIGSLPLANGDWSHRSAGIAIYRTPKVLHTFRLNALPPERVVVGERFAVTPLLTSLTCGNRFHILAISRNSVRLLDADSSSFERAELADLPADLESALNLQGADRGMQVHSGVPGKRKQSAVFHGQGGRADKLPEDLNTYWRMIDAAVREYLSGTNGPVFLAGVDAEIHGYRASVRHGNLAEASITGNFDRAGDREIYDRALPLAREFFGRDREIAAEKFRELDGTAMATANIEVILPAAKEGRVETLFVNPRESMAGRSYGEGRSTVDEQGSVAKPDLIETTVAETIRNGGQVYAVNADDMPGPGALAALFRY